MPLVVLSLVALLGGAPLHATPPDAKARHLYTSGLAAYDAGRYDLAIEAFEEAYRLAPADLLLFDLAQAYRKQFLTKRTPYTLDRAIALYWQFLASPAKGRERLQATEALEELLVLSSAPPPAAKPPPVEPRAAQPQILSPYDDEPETPALPPVGPRTAPTTPLPAPVIIPPPAIPPWSPNPPARPKVPPGFPAHPPTAPTTSAASQKAQPTSPPASSTRRGWIVGGVTIGLLVTLAIGIGVGLGANP